MSVAELLLRVGCNTVAWLIIYTHCLWLAVLKKVGCGSDLDTLWQVLLVFLPFTLLFGSLLDLTRKIGGVHDGMRWGAAPLILLVPLALSAIWPTLTSATFDGMPICTAEPAPWHPWWAPLQLLLVGYICFKAYKAWLPTPPTTTTS